MNAKQSFKQVYSLTRTNRHNIHFRGQTFRFEGGFIYVGDETLVIRGNDRPTFLPGDYAPAATKGFSKDFRRYYYIQRSREVGRVPLP